MAKAHELKPAVVAAQTSKGDAVSLLRHATLGSEEGFLLYDADLRVIMHNPVLERIMYQRIPRPKPGDRMRDIARDLFACGWLKLPPGIDADTAAAGMEQQVIGEISNLEIQLASGRTVVTRSSATTQGG